MLTVITMLLTKYTAFYVEPVIYQRSQSRAELERGEQLLTGSSIKYSGNGRAQAQAYLVQR